MRKYTYQRTGTGAFDIPAADKPEVYDSNGELCTVQNAYKPAVSKHTKGPWKYGGFADHCDVGRAYHEITDADGFEIINQNGIVTDEGDARLIAAAPELLDALKNLLWQHDNNAGQLCGMALQDARAAISKATGE